MSLSTIATQAIPVTMDVATINHAATVRGDAAASTATAQVDKTAQQNSTEVVKKDDAILGNKKFDAREKGSNEYVASRDKKEKKKKDEEDEGRVVLKTRGPNFDIKV